MTEAEGKKMARWKTDGGLFIAAAAALLAVSLLLHFWRLGELPNGFYFDESSIGYNAWSLSLNWKDEYGTTLPLFFRGLDNYHDPVMVYSLVPPLRFSAPSELAVRLPSAAYCIMASIAFYFLLRFYGRNRWLCLQGAFIFSVLPWVFPLSRVNFAGYMPMLLGINAGWLFLLKALRKKCYAAACISALAWAFAMYSHNCGRPASAAVLACFLLAFNTALLKRIRILACFAGVLLAALVPLLLAYLNNPACLTSRFGEISLWNASAGAGDFAMGLLQRYLEYFSPEFLFKTGDPELRHNIGIYGVLFTFMLPLVALGMAHVIMGFRRNPHHRFILLCLASYPLAAILTKDHFHSTRCMNGAPFWCLVAAMGLWDLWRRSRKSRFLRLFFAIFAVLAVFDVARYMAFYFGPYEKLSRANFDAPLIEALKFASQDLAPDETLYVSSSAFYLPVDSGFKPLFYAHLLFFMQVDPLRYQHDGLPNERVRPYPCEIGAQGMLLRMNSKIIFMEGGSPAAVPNDEPLPPGCEPVRRIPLKEDSDRFLEIYKVSQ